MPNSNSRAPLPEVSDEEIKDWSQEVVTKYFGKLLLDHRQHLLENAILNYVEGDADGTYGNIAEVAGAVKFIDSLFTATVSGTPIFSIETLEENKANEPV